MITHFTDEKTETQLNSLDLHPTVSEGSVRSRAFWKQTTHRPLFLTGRVKEWEERGVVDETPLGKKASIGWKVLM